jgi:hypothetical protein
VALPALNLLYVLSMAGSRWSRSARRRGCALLLFGTLGLPILLVLAAFWDPARSLLPVPVLALSAAVGFLAAGLRRPQPGEDGPR